MSVAVVSETFFMHLGMADGGHLICIVVEGGRDDGYSVLDTLSGSGSKGCRLAEVENFLRVVAKFCRGYVGDFSPAGYSVVSGVAPA